MPVPISQDTTMNKTTKKLCDEVGIDIEYLTNTKQIVLIENLVKRVAEHCALLCGSQADKKIIRSAFDLPVESNVQYEAPPIHGSVTSQYTREYNIPK
jgi:predicted methyltransferase MtxX (methanogen marker protein 4)